MLLAALDFGIVRDNAPQLWRGFVLTLEITVAGVAGALLVGAAGAAMRATESFVLRALATAFTEFFRNTPPLVLIYFLFFALPQIPGAGAYLRLPAVAAATLGLVLHQGAINIEILRAGLGAVPAGQREAAEALGLSPFARLRYVLVPQAVRISLPALGNNAISLFKNTVLVSPIGVLDLMGEASDIIATILVSAELYLTVGVVYLVSVAIFSGALRSLEARFAAVR